MATFASDTFTDTSGTELDSHTGETGATWSRNTSLGGGNVTMVISNANRCRRNAITGWGAYTASGSPANANYKVSGTIRFITDTGGTMGVVGRSLVTTDTMYFAEYNRNGTDAEFRLMKVVSASYTEIASWAETLTAGEERIIRLEMDGDQISVYVDGTLRVGPVTDTAITAAGKAGIRGFETATDTTNIHIDTFSAEDVASGATGTAAQTLPKLTQAVSGAETISGAGAQQAPALTQAASGDTSSALDATVAQTLPSLGQAAAGTETFTGAAAQSLPALTQAADGTAGAFAPLGVEFDGTNDYMTRGANLTGAASGSQGSCSFWINPNATSLTLQRVLNGYDVGLDFSAVDIVYSGAGALEDKFQFSVTNATDSAVFIVRSVGTYDESDGWLCVLISWDTNFTSGNKIGLLYVNDASDATVQSDASAAFDVGLSVVDDWGVGAHPADASSKLNACLAEFWFTNEYIDFSVEANRRKFINADGTPADLGSDGSTPTGTAPLVYQSYRQGDAVTAFATNRGSGGNFTITGTLTECATAPAVNDNATGTAAQTLPGLQQAASGTAILDATGTAAQTLPGLGQAAAGVELLTGAVDQTLPGLGQTAAAAETITGAAVQTLPSLAQAAEGLSAAPVSGVGAQILPFLRQALIGHVRNGWTPAGPGSGGWAPQANDDSIWTPASAAGGTWT